LIQLISVTYIIIYSRIFCT